MLQSVPQTAGAGIAKVISTSAFTPMGRPSGSPMTPGALAPLSAGFFPTRPPAPFSRRRALITAPSSARSAARVFRWSRSILVKPGASPKWPASGKNRQRRRGHARALRRGAEPPVRPMADAVRDQMKELRSARNALIKDRAAAKNRAQNLAGLARDAIPQKLAGRPIEIWFQGAGRPARHAGPHLGQARHAPAHPARPAVHLGLSVRRHLPGTRHRRRPGHAGRQYRRHEPASG